MKSRDISLDCIRVLSIFIIVIFHYAATMPYNGSALIFHANGTWGSIGTAVFFILSGYLLRKHYADITSVLDFYKRRFVTIFPAFYMAFLVCYLINVIRQRSFFYMGAAYPLVYSVLGIDNLVKQYGLTTYAVVGEWFTGVIIILYALFPVFNRLIKKNKWGTTAVFFVIYVVVNMFEWRTVLPEISVLSCGFIFWIGMLIAEYSDYLRKNTFIGIISLLAAIILLFVRVPVQRLFINHFISLLFFISGVIILKGLKSDTAFGGAMVFLSNTSYAVYLTHHYILNVLASVNEKIGIVNNIPFMSAFAGYLIVVMITSVVLYYSSRAVSKRLFS